MPAFQKWSLPEWTTKIKSKSERQDAEDGNNPAPQRPAPAEDPQVAKPISLPAEDPILESRRQQAIAFMQKVQARSDHVFKEALEILRMYMDGRKSIEEVDELAASGFKDHGDLLAEFRSFLPPPGTSSRVLASTPQMSVPKCRQGKRAAQPDFSEQSPSEKMAGMAGDTVGRKQSSKRPAAAVVKEKNAQEPARRSARVPKPRVIKDIESDQGKKRSCMDNGGNGVALKTRRQAQAELTEQKRQDEQQKRQAELAEQRRLAIYEAWWPEHLKPQDNSDEIEIDKPFQKPSPQGKYWYPWINQEPEVECPDSTKSDGPEVQPAGSSASQTPTNSIYAKFERYWPILN